MTTEIVQTIPAELETAISQTGLAMVDAAALAATYAPHFRKFHELADTAQTVGADQPKRARAVRLELKAVRTSAENTRKSLKEDSLRRGKAIDAYKHILDDALVPVEQAMEEIEKAEERREADRIANLKASRATELEPFVDNTSFYDLGNMTVPAWEQLLAGAKAAKEAVRVAAEKAEAERLAALAAAEAERVRLETEAAAEVERLRLEAERLAAENKRLADEKGAADAKAAEIEAAARAEREAAAERELEASKAAIKAAAEAQDKADAELARVQAEAKAKADKERADRDEADRQERLRLRAEQDAKAAETKRIQDEANAKAAAAQAEVDRLAKAERDRVAAVAQADADAAAEVKRKAAAPDKEKLSAFAHAIRSLPVPELATERALEIRAHAIAAMLRVAEKIELAAGEM